MAVAGTIHAALLGVHIAAGGIGLALGPLAMMAPKRPGRHPRTGVVYQAVLATLTISAVALAASAPARLWWLGVIAVATEAAALGGWWVARRRSLVGWAGTWG